MISRFLKKCAFLLIFGASFSGISQSKDVAIHFADQFYEKQDYHNALINYLFAANDSVIKSIDVVPYEVSTTSQKVNPKSKKKEAYPSSREEYLNHKIAQCYRYTQDYKRAEIYYEKTQNSEHYPEDLFQYGASLMNNKKYEEAMEVFNRYKASENINDSLMRATQLAITGCFYAIEANKSPSQAVLELADTAIFNKGTADFGVRYFGNKDRLTFTSAREGGVILKPEQESEYLCDVYWVEREGGNWKEATNFGRPMNSAQHDAAAAWNNGNTIFYSRWSDDERPDVKIHLSRMKDFMFYEAFVLSEPVNVDGYKSKHPFVTKDGRTMYFSSDKPGGKGGFDIWMIQLDKLGNPLGEAVNLDYPINSELDEVTPFFHEPSSTLFFSSNGYNSIGGFDVYSSFFNLDDSTYQKPKNLGVPINSSKDDTYLIWDDELRTGFISSDRAPCEFGHCYDIYEVKNEPIIISLSGNTYVKYDEDPLDEVNLTFKDVDGNFQPFEMLTNQTGYYDTILAQGIELFIKATKEGYFADAAILNTKNITTSTDLKQDFYLDKIPEKEIEIEGIEYDFNSDKLRPISMEILDKLYDFLVLNNNLVVEINSHTDFRGTDSYNLDLSQRRAKSCVDYLIEKGIDPSRLIAKGYGESQPNILKNDKKPVLDINGEEVYLTEKFIKAEKDKELVNQYHQKNRRTSFIVVGENFEKKSI